MTATPHMQKHRRGRWSSPKNRQESPSSPCRSPASPHEPPLTQPNPRLCSQTTPHQLPSGHTGVPRSRGRDRRHTRTWGGQSQGRPQTLILPPGPAYLRAARAPPAAGGERQPRLRSRGRGHVAPVAPAEEVSGTRAGRRPGSHCPGEGSRQRASCTRRRGAASRREDAGGTGAGFWGRFCDAAFPDTSCFRPRSASIPASGA